MFIHTRYPYVRHCYTISACIDTDIHISACNEKIPFIFELFSRQECGALTIIAASWELSAAAYSIINEWYIGEWHGVVQNEDWFDQVLVADTMADENRYPMRISHNGKYFKNLIENVGVSKSTISQ